MGGIGVNNNIVLIDTFDRLKGTTKTAKEAIPRTGAQRLRPVLLTSVTTILSLLPMVLGVNIDFIIREISIGAPAMQCLTLVVTPSALMIKVNVHDWLARRRTAVEKNAKKTAAA